MIITLALAIQYDRDSPDMLRLLQEKTKKIIDIWTKARTFPVPLLERLSGLISGVSVQGAYQSHVFAKYQLSFPFGIGETSTQRTEILYFAQTSLGISNHHWVACHSRQHPLVHHRHARRSSTYPRRSLPLRLLMMYRMLY